MYKSVALQVKTVGTVLLMALVFGFASSVLFAPKAEAMFGNIVGAPIVAPAKTTMSQAAMLAKIQELMKLLVEMQRQLAVLQGEVLSPNIALSNIVPTGGKVVLGEVMNASWRLNWLGSAKYQTCSSFIRKSDSKVFSQSCKTAIKGQNVYTWTPSTTTASDFRQGVYHIQITVSKLSTSTTNNNAPIVKRFGGWFTVVAEDDDTATTTLSFALTDVKTVTSQYIDPNPMMADEEYTMYTITLKSGRVVKVRACGFCTLEGRNKAFTDKGYTGDVALLMAMATEVPDTNATSTPKVETMARVVLGTSGVLGNSGTGNLAKTVVFTDGTSVPFGTWFPLTKDGKAIVDPKAITGMTASSKYAAKGIILRRIGGNVIHLVNYAHHATSTAGTSTKNYEYITANLVIKDGQFVPASLRALTEVAPLEKYPLNAPIVAKRNRDSVLMASTNQIVRFSFFSDLGADGLNVAYKYMPGTPTADVLGVSISSVESQFNQIVSDFALIVEGYRELVK